MKPGPGIELINTVTHPSTNRSQCCLTSVIDCPVYSSSYHDALHGKSYQKSPVYPPDLTKKLKNEKAILHFDFDL